MPNMNAVIKSSDGWAFYAVDTIEEKTPEKCIKIKPVKKYQSQVVIEDWCLFDTVSGMQNSSKK